MRSARIRRRAIVVVLCIGLAGCASGMVPMSSNPVDPRWPLLRTSYWFGEPADVVAKCYAAVPGWAKALGGLATACSYVDFSALTCGINVSYGHYGELGHELSHCYGSSHVTDDMLGAWEAHLQKQFDVPVFVNGERVKGLTAYNYRRALDGKTVTVTRDAKRALRYGVLP